MSTSPVGSPTSYPVLPGEFGVIDSAWPWGAAPRYGILPNTGINYENTGQMETLYLNACLPGVRGAMPRGRYCGHSSSAFESNYILEVEGVESTGIIHVIGRGIAATASGTMASGILTATAIILGGANYFAAPQVSAFSGGSGLTLNGVALTANMTASSVYKIVNGGSGFTAGQIVPLQNGISILVGTIDAGGGILTASINAGGSMVDPTANTWGNRYYAGASPQTATAWFLIGFSVLSLNIMNGGSGGTSSVAIYIETPPLLNIIRSGKEIGWARLGVQGAKNFHIDSYHAKSNPAINVDGQVQPGAHFDYESDGYIGEYICDATGQTGLSDTNGWSAISIDGAGMDQAQRIRFGLIDVANCAFHGVAIAASVRIDTLRVRSFGQIAANTSVQQFGPARPGAWGLLVERGVPDIGTLEVYQNEALMGASALGHILFSSTGMQQPNQTAISPHSPENPFSMTEVVIMRPAMIGNIVARNVCGMGICCVDTTFPDPSNPCLVEVAGLVSVEYSTVKPMATGFLSRAYNGTTYGLDHPGIAISPNPSGDPVAFHASDYRFTSSNGVGTTVPNHFYAGPGTQTSWRTMSDLQHSSGIIALLENDARGHITARSTDNVGMPFSGSLPLVWLNATPDALDISLDADCGLLHQVRPAVWANGPVGGALEIVAVNYRNTPLVDITAPTGLQLRRCKVIGLGGSETGLMLRGGFVGMGFSHLDIEACLIGIGVASATFDATCYGMGNKCAGNATQTQIPMGAIPAQLACTSFTL